MGVSISRGLLIAGAAIFLLLGTAHGLMSLLDLRKPRFFTPPDPSLRLAMQQASARLHPHINLWNAWMGFNLSHSLGVMMFGAALLDVGVLHPLVFTRSILLQLLAPTVAGLYLLLSMRFWFYKPTIGCALALACFAAASLVAHL